MASFYAASEEAEGKGACCFFSSRNAVVKKEVHFAMALAKLDSRNHRGTFRLRLFQPRERTGFVLDSRLGNIENATYSRYESEFVDVTTICNVIKSCANDGVI